MEIVRERCFNNGKACFQQRLWNIKPNPKCVAFYEEYTRIIKMHKKGKRDCTKCYNDMKIRSSLCTKSPVFVSMKSENWIKQSSKLNADFFQSRFRIPNLVFEQRLATKIS